MKMFTFGQWFWHSWRSSHLRLQRTRVRIQPSEPLLAKIKKKRPEKGHLRLSPSLDNNIEISLPISIRILNYGSSWGVSLTRKSKCAFPSSLLFLRSCRVVNASGLIIPFAEMIFFIRKVSATSTLYFESRAKIILKLFEHFWPFSLSPY